MRTIIIVNRTALFTMIIYMVFINRIFLDKRDKLNQEVLIQKLLT